MWKCIAGCSGWFAGLRKYRLWPAKTAMTFRKNGKNGKYGSHLPIAPFRAYHRNNAGVTISFVTLSFLQALHNSRIANSFSLSVTPLLPIRRDGSARGHHRSHCPRSVFPVHTRPRRVARAQHRVMLLPQPPLSRGLQTAADCSPGEEWGRACVIALFFRRGGSGVRNLSQLSRTGTVFSSQHLLP